MDLWGLPTPLVEAVALHHEPDETGDSVLTALTAVHAANSLELEGGPSDPNRAQCPLDEDYLRWLDMHQRIPGWRDELAAL